MSALDMVVEEYPARGSTGVSGVVLSVINKQIKTLLSETSGYASHLPDGEKMTPYHIFRQISTTKLFTIICTLQLVQAGKVSLDDVTLIDAHLPEITNQQIFHLADDGVGYDIFTFALLAWRKEQGIYQSALMTKFMGGKMSESIPTAFLFEPGEGRMYGAGIDADKPEMKEKLVGVAVRKEDGTLRAISGPNNDTPIDASGDTGLYSSPDDFVKVLQGLLQDEPKVLSKEYADMLFSPPQQPEESSTLKALRAQLPLLFSIMGVLHKHVSISHSFAGLLWTGSEQLPQAEDVAMWFGALGKMWFVHREKGIAGYYESELVPPGDVKNVEVMRAFSKVALTEILAC